MAKNASITLEKLLSFKLHSFLSQPKIRKKQNRLRKKMAAHKKKWGY